jgi:glycosyltransferase involved in cell wall biosynthesis
MILINGFAHRRSLLTTSSNAEPSPVSFIMPAYNCGETVEESVNSIVHGNFDQGDEIIIVDDCSTDMTAIVLQAIKEKYPFVTILAHARNKGGAAARNTAVEHANNPLIFCLDSDNILVMGSVSRLKEHLQAYDADVASFQGLQYFQSDIAEHTHKWLFNEGLVTLADCLAGTVFPGASGNYLYTRESWVRAGGYPEFAGALDAWGFGFRQLATGARMVVMADSYYYHRYGHESYWARDSRRGKISLTALQIMIPHLELIHDRDVDYVMDRRWRQRWFERLDTRPLRVKSGAVGRTGKAVDPKGNPLAGAAVPNIVEKALTFIRGKSSQL